MRKRGDPGIVEVRVERENGEEMVRSFMWTL